MEIQGVVNARNYVFRVGLPEHIINYLRGGEEEDIEAGFDDVFASLEEQGGIAIESEDDDDEEAE